MSSVPSSDSFQRARQRHQTAMNAAFAGSVTIAGRIIRAVSVTLGRVMLELPGGGARETRSLSVTFDKSLMTAEPSIGSIVLHEGLEYCLNVIEGRESWQTSWKFNCIEKERG